MRHSHDTGMVLISFLMLDNHIPCILILTETNHQLLHGSPENFENESDRDNDDNNNNNNNNINKNNKKIIIIIILIIIMMMIMIIDK